MNDFRTYLASGASILLCASAAVALQPEEASSAPQRTSTCTTPANEARPWLNSSYSPECRARKLMSGLTLDQKIGLLADRQHLEAWLIDHGLFGIVGGDGPAGIRGADPDVTAFPTPLAMSASFDTSVARKYGEAVGQEVTDLGRNQITGPAMDIARTWHFGRVTESFGEDPFLSASMVGQEVAGISSKHVIATAKHFAVYTQDANRDGDNPFYQNPAVNAVVSEKAIREIYLPAFKSAVVDGGAGRVMCAMYRVNGVYACENRPLLDVLKKEWGFDGPVVPDAPDGQRSIVDAFNAGLDQGVMVQAPAGSEPRPPFGSLPYFNGPDFADAVHSGKISTARVDDMLQRALVPAFRLGVFDHPPQRVATDVSTAARRSFAADAITDGAVLLKNDGGVLPLGGQVKSVAVIGWQAGPRAIVTELGSPYVAASHLEAVLPAVRARAGSVEVNYAQGSLGLDRMPLIPTGMVKSAKGEAGFTAEYFANIGMDFTGKPFLVRQETTINNTLIKPTPAFPGAKHWSARWTGMFTPDQTGMQHFTLDGLGMAKLFIDGKLVTQYQVSDLGNNAYADVPMKAGVPVEIRVEYSPRTSTGDTAMPTQGTYFGALVRLGWSGPNHLIDEAVEAARKSDVAFVFVGHKIGEGADRVSLGLPGDEDELIEAVARANPKTVVVLQTGGAVAMPWLDRVAGVLEMWLPGDSFGPAAAALMFGDKEPGGRLPVTFPANEQQGPAIRQDEYPGSIATDGHFDQANYREGVFVGYRFWDQFNQKPLFPFGYGLSYSSFKVTLGDIAKTPEGGVAVNAEVQNTGARSASEVVQVYVGFPSAAEEAPKQLKGFSKVELKPSEKKSVKILLRPEDLAWWDEGRHAWVLPGGNYNIMVGASSRDIVGSKTISVAGRAIKMATAQ